MYTRTYMYMHVLRCGVYVYTCINVNNMSPEEKKVFVSNTGTHLDLEDHTIDGHSIGSFEL